MASVDVKDEIKRFGIFLRQLQFGQELSNGWTDKPFTLFTREDFTLILTEQDAEGFEGIVDALYEAIGRRHAIAKATVSRLASECAVKVARFSDSKGGSSFDALIDATLQELRDGLFAPDRTWRLFLPVGGLAPSGLPMIVGQVSFRFGDQQTMDDLRGQARHVRTLSNVLNSSNAFAEQSFNDDASRLQDSAIAIVDVEAVDHETARMLVLKTLRSTLDCINFYADRSGWGMWAYLYGDTSCVNEPFVVFRLSKEGTPDAYSMGGQMVGPTRSLPLNQLGNRQGFRRISEMLAKPKLGCVEERLLTSIQWAGRAQVDPRPEEAFLLYAISLESLLLGRTRSEELSYRLRLRCAHLIAPPERRHEVRNKIRDLYSLRSKIVHSGSTIVSEAELALLRGYCRKAIFRILNDPSFRQLTSDEDLEEWFEQQALGTPSTNR